MVRMLIVLLLASPLAAQAYLDSLSFGGIGSDTAYGFAADAAGNTYAAVHFDGTVDLQPGAGVHNESGFLAGAVVKYDTSRNVTWSYLLEPQGGADRAIPEMPAVDPSGNVYVAGRFTGAVDFDPSGAGAIENALDTGGSPATYCAFLLKISPAGVFQWVRVLPGNYSWGYRIAVTDTQAFLTGIYSGTMDLDPTAATNIATTPSLSAFFAMFDASGTQQWAVGNSGSGIELATPGVIGAGGDVTYISSYIIDTTLGQGGPTYITTGNCDMMIVHYTAAGTLDWVREIGTAGANIVPAWMSPGAGGAMYVVGTLNGAGGADFDPGPGVTTLTPQTAPNAFVAKYDSNGDLSWGCMLNGTGNSDAFACTTDAAGVVIFGQIAGTADADPGTGTASHDASTGNILAVRLDSNGDYVWSANFGAGVGGAEVYGAASTSNGTLIVGGPYSATADWDPGTGVAQTTPSAGQDGFMVWLDDASAGGPPNPPTLSITTATIAAVAEGTPAGAVFSASGGTNTGYQWSVVNGSLPPGVTGLPGTGTPSISLGGAPTAAGTYMFRVRVEDSAANADERDFSWIINAAPTTPPTSPPKSGGGDGGGGCAAGGSTMIWLLAPLAFFALGRRRRRA